MPVWIAYVDESHDDSRFCLSAMLIRHTEWSDCFQKIKAFRAEIKEEFDLPMSYEIHAHEFVAGRGRPSKSRIITKWERSRIFHRLLSMIASLPKVLLFNVCLEKHGRKNPQVDAWDRLVNRIERTMVEMERTQIKLQREVLSRLDGIAKEADLGFLKNRLDIYKSTTIIIADEGHEHEITRAVRKMRVYNQIPSRYGSWADGKSTKNIIAEHIIEDPVFKPSARSYFIQLADCLAFALLKKEVEPTPNIRKYGINKMLELCCSGVCYKKASKTDPLGIVRK